MHACTHACTHSLSHTHTHAYTHILTHARTHMHTLTYAPMHTHTTSSQIKSEGGGSSSYRWCKGRGLEQQRFYEMAKLRQQFQEILQVLTAMCLHHELQTNLQPRLSVLNFILQLWVLQGCKTKSWKRQPWFEGSYKSPQPRPKASCPWYEARTTLQLSLLHSPPPAPPILACLWPGNENGDMGTVTDSSLFGCVLCPRG